MSIKSLALYSAPFIMFYLVSIFRIIAGAGTLLHATDVEIPPPDPKYYFWSLVYPYHPLYLGSWRLPHLYELFYGLVVAITLGNRFLSQAIILSAPPILSYACMLLLLRKGLKLSPIASVFGALIFAFSPVYIASFTTGYFLSYSFLPLIFYAEHRILKILTEDQKPNPVEILLNTWLLTLALGLVNSLLFQALPLTMILLVFHMFVVLFVMKAIGRRSIAYLILILGLSLLTFTFMSPRALETLILGTKPSVQTSFKFLEEQTLPALQIYWKDFMLINVMRLSGGNPLLKAFPMFNSRWEGFALPIFAFLSLALLCRRHLRNSYTHSQVAFLFSSIVVAVVLIGLAPCIPFLIQASVTNPVFFILMNTLRSPDRILMLLTLFYAVLIAFSVDGLVRLVSGKARIFHNNPAIIVATRGHLRSHIDYKKTILILLLIVMLMLPYSRFVGIYSLDTFSYHYSPRPVGYNKIEGYLNEKGDELGSNRFLILPLYQQLMAEERYYHPSLFYSSPLFSPEVSNYVNAVNDLIGRKSPNALDALGLASVKYILVVPDSFKEDELAPWRLKGPIKVEGSYLFGDPSEYALYLSKLSPSSLIQNHPFPIFLNNKSVEFAYAPTLLIDATGEMSDVFDSLGIIDSILGINERRYVLSMKENSASDPSFKIVDLEGGNVTDIYMTKVKNFNFSYRDVELFPSDFTFKVWSDNFTMEKVETDGGQVLRIRVEVPHDKSYVSIWLIPRSNSLNVTASNVHEISLAGKILAENLYMKLIDMDWRTLFNLKAEIVGHEAGYDQHSVIAPTVISSNNTIRLIAVTLEGDPGSTVEMELHGVTLKSCDGLHIQLPKTVYGGSRDDDLLYVLLAYEDAKLPWYKLNFADVIQTKSVNKLETKAPIYGKYAIIGPFKISDLRAQSEISIFSSYLRSMKPVDLILVSSKPLDAMTIHNLEIKFVKNSPTEFSFLLSFDVTSNENQSSITIPLFLGLAYNEHWKASIIKHTDGYEVDIIDHTVGNGYANLWLIELRTTPTAPSHCEMAIRIHYDNLSLIIHRVYSIILITFYIVMPILVKIYWGFRFEESEGSLG